jgi:hypothetical protein
MIISIGILHDTRNRHTLMQHRIAPRSSVLCGWIGPDYLRIQKTEGKIRGICNVQKKSFVDNVKPLKGEILYLIVYNNNILQQ